MKSARTTNSEHTWRTLASKWRPSKSPSNRSQSWHWSRTKTSTSTCSPRTVSRLSHFSVLATPASRTLATGMSLALLRSVGWFTLSVANLHHALNIVAATWPRCSSLYLTFQHLCRGTTQLMLTTCRPAARTPASVSSANCPRWPMVF